MWRSILRRLVIQMQYKEISRHRCAIDLIENTTRLIVHWFKQLILNHCDLYPFIIKTTTLLRANTNKVSVTFGYMSHHHVVEMLRQLIKTKIMGSVIQSNSPRKSLNPPFNWLWWGGCMGGPPNSAVNCSSLPFSDDFYLKCHMTPLEIIGEVFKNPGFILFNFFLNPARIRMHHV